MGARQATQVYEVRPWSIRRSWRRFPRSASAGSLFRYASGHTAKCIGGYTLGRGRARAKRLTSVELNLPHQAPTESREPSMSNRRFALAVASIYVVGVALRLVWLATSDVERPAGNAAAHERRRLLLGGRDPTDLRPVRGAACVLAPADNAARRAPARLVTHNSPVGIDTFSVLSARLCRAGHRVTRRDPAEEGANLKLFEKHRRASPPRYHAGTACQAQGHQRPGTHRHRRQCVRRQ